MSIQYQNLKLRSLALALTALFIISACGGGSDTTETPIVNDPVSTTGTVGLFITDVPTDEFSAIKLNVLQAILMGDDDGQQVLFEGSKPIDLLDLTNFNEPIIFGEVEVGTYTKLRLIIDELQLVPHEGDPIFPKLPANGKIDLLDSSGFDVLPDRILMVEIDMDANKSIKVTGAGNSDKYNFRPVVKVRFQQHKLARVEGSVSEIPDPAGNFVLCDIDSPESCVNVMTDGLTSIFNNEGLATNFDSLAQFDPVVVIGRYETDPEIVLNALVLEIGGNAEQVKGKVVSDPVDGQFLLLVDDTTNLVIEMQPGTRYFDAEGEIAADAVVLAAAVEVEGVKPPKALETDPDLMRAALVFVEAEDDDQIGGTITNSIAEEFRSFELTMSDGTTACARVDADADILLVDEDNSVVTKGVFTDLAVGDSVDLFGMISAVDGCIDANEVIVAVVAAP